MTRILLCAPSFRQHGVAALTLIEASVHLAPETS